MKLAHAKWVFIVFCIRLFRKVKAFFMPKIKTKKHIRPLPHLPPKVTSVNQKMKQIPDHVHHYLVKHVKKHKK